MICKNTSLKLDMGVGMYTMCCNIEVDDSHKEASAHLTVSLAWTTAQPRQRKLFLFCLLLNSDAETGLTKRGEGTTKRCYLACVSNKSWEIRKVVVDSFLVHLKSGL